MSSSIGTRHRAAVYDSANGRRALQGMGRRGGRAARHRACPCASGQRPPACGFLVQVGARNGQHRCAGGRPGAGNGHSPAARRVDTGEAARRDRPLGLGGRARAPSAGAWGGAPPPSSRWIGGWKRQPPVLDGSCPAREAYYAARSRRRRARVATPSTGRRARHSGGATRPETYSLCAAGPHGWLRRSRSHWNRVVHQGDRVMAQIRRRWPSSRIRRARALYAQAIPPGQVTWTSGASTPSRPCRGFGVRMDGERPSTGGPIGAQVQGQARSK